MKPLTPDQIRGNWTTLLSAWNADDSLDLGRIAAEIDALIAMRVDGIYSNGTAGEFHAQTEAEFDRISQCLAEKCSAAGMPFQIGVSHMSAQISRERLRRIVTLAPGAVQVVLPDWFPLTDAEADRLMRIADDLGTQHELLVSPPHFDTQHVLPHGTPEDVACTTRQMIGILVGRGGGYIVAPSHVLQTDVPTENIVALCDAAKQE